MSWNTAPYVLDRYSRHWCGSTCSTCILNPFSHWPLKYPSFLLCSEPNRAERFNKNMQSRFIPLQCAIILSWWLWHLNKQISCMDPEEIRNTREQRENNRAFEFFLCRTKLLEEPRRPGGGAGGGSWSSGTRWLSSLVKPCGSGWPTRSATPPSVLPPRSSGWSLLPSCSALRAAVSSRHHLVGQ